MSNAKNPECCNLYNYSRACGSFSSGQSLFWNWGWGAEGSPSRYGRARGQKASQSSTREIIKSAWHRMHAGAHSNTPEYWPCSSKQCREWLAFQKYNFSLVLEKGIDKILQILFWLGEIKKKIPSFENSGLLLGDLAGMLDLMHVTDAGHRDNLKSCQKKAIYIFVRSFAMSGREREGARGRKRKQVVELVTGCAHSLSVELPGRVVNAIHPFNTKKRRKKKTGLTQGMYCSLGKWCP